MIAKETHYREKNEKLNYIVYTPNACREGLPLIVFLHGAGERGTKLENLNRHGIPRLIQEGREYEAVMLVPQCHENRVWNNVVDELMQLIDTVAEKYQVDPKRISITGGSMGGFGTWEMGMTFPDTFSAIGPVCGGGLSWRASNLVNTPVFAYHGAKDDIVPIVYSQLMVDAVRASGGSAAFEVFDELGHNDAIDMAYRETDMIDKLIHSVKKEGTVPEALSEYFD